MAHEPNDDTMVIVFESGGVAAEAEAQAIRALLESSGVESMLVRQNVPEVPVGKVEVRVMDWDAERARAIIEEARRAGPEAAEAAEAETEI